MNQCPKCNATLADNATFCTNCGNRLAAEPAAASSGFFNSAGNLDGSPVAPKPTPAPAPRPAPMPTPTPAPQPAPAPRPAPMPNPAPAPAPADAPPANLYTPTPVAKKPSRRISAGKELKLLLRQGILILLGEKRNLIISLLFPFIAAIITVWIAGEEMFVTYEATKSGCFILVCAAIWGGLFNSIQSLVKERDNIKRDYVSGALRIECYMGSRAIIQIVLCAFQSFVLAMSIPCVEWFRGNAAPDSGILFGGLVFIEFYLSLFFIMLASDAMGLMISSFVKKEELASKLAPYILIAQLLFSGVLFELEGGAKILSCIMISRWGMEALGITCDLNSMNTKIYNSLTDESHDCPFAGMSQTGECCYTGVTESLQLPKQSGPAFDMFEASSEHMILVLLIMLGFIVVSLVAADLLLHRVKKDGRD